MKGLDFGRHIHQTRKCRRPRGMPTFKSSIAEVLIARRFHTTYKMISMARDSTLAHRAVAAETKSCLRSRAAAVRRNPN